MIVTSATISGATSTTFTFSLTPTSAATTSTGKAIDLAGLNKVFKVYLTNDYDVTSNKSAALDASWTDIRQVR